MSLPSKTLVIANPLAGSRGARWRGQKPETVLRPLFPRAELYFTKAGGEATEVARQAAADGFELVVAAGGDGTVNEVANGLAGTETQMGLFPLGTENVLAKERHIPPQFDKAVALLQRTQPRQIDLGLIGDRYFVCFAGIGFDAHVCERVKPSHKARLGSMAYVTTAMEHYFRYNETKRLFKIQVDDEFLEVESWQILFGNIQCYGGGLKATPRASMHDGLIDMLIMPRTDLPGMVKQVVAAATGNHLKLPEVRYYQARKIHVECSVPTSFQYDGDLGGSTPITVEVAPKALWARF
jgi:diacylglycerol kinase (ATP)